MAKKAKVEKKPVDTKELNKLLGEYLFEEPETLEDGTIKTPRYETGIIMFDLLLNGGLPKGRAIAIGAEYGAGKTTLLIQACGNVIERYNKKVYYIDVEGGATYELFEAMGFANLLYNPKTNPDGKLYLLSIKTIQDISKIVKRVAEDPETAVIVIDSATQVTDQLAIDDELLGTGKNDVGLNARMWSKVTRPMNAIINESEACLLIVHQARVNLAGFMPKIESASGNALKHLVSVDVWGKRKAWIGPDNTWVKNRKEAVGSYVKLTTEKNRLTKPFATVEFPIFFGRGVSNKWAYKEWLETHTVADKATGEVTPVLNKVGAGYYTLTLPSGPYKCRGDVDMWKLIDEHLEEIISYVNANGGFTVGIDNEADSE
jgi:RecA/RadA recombinase